MAESKKADGRKRRKTSSAAKPADAWWVSNSTRKGFSYRDRWLEEASSLPFEIWLKAKGVFRNVL